MRAEGCRAEGRRAGGHRLAAIRLRQRRRQRWRRACWRSACCRFCPTRPPDHQTSPISPHPPPPPHTPSPVPRYNFWGYSTTGFFAPMSRYSAAMAAGRPGGEVADEFKTLVRECHRRGIEVILDVVFNHTAEGNEKGPVLSFRWGQGCGLGRCCAAGWLGGGAAAGWRRQPLVSGGGQGAGGLRQPLVVVLLSWERPALGGGLGWCLCRFRSLGLAAACAPWPLRPPPIAPQRRC
jgi:hypothetical protein